jgi:hypothetical protein
MLGDPHDPAWTQSPGALAVVPITTALPPPPTHSVLGAGLLNALDAVESTNGRAVVSEGRLLR